MSFFQKFVAAVSYGGESDPNELFRQDFDGTEGVGGEPSGWEDSVGIDFDNATDPLAGSHSASGTASNALIATPTFAAQSTIYTYFMWHASTLTGDVGLIEFFSGGARQVRIRVRSTGAIRIYNPDLATFGTSSSSLISAAQAYHVWVDFTVGTGSDGVVNTYFSTTSTKPGSPTYTYSSHTGTLNIDQVKFPVVATGSPTVKWDNVLGSIIDLADDPF